MRIKQPELLKFESKVAFDNFASYYNAGQQTNASKIKSAHIQLYRFLVDFADKKLRVQIALAKNPKVFEADSEYAIFIKPSYIASALKCVHNAAKARLRRLESTEIISVDYIPDEQEYKITFNDNLLFIKGENRPNLFKNSLFAKPVKISKLKRGGYQNLIPSISINSNKLINISITEYGVNNSNINSANIQIPARIINEEINKVSQAKQTKVKHKQQDSEEKNSQTANETPEKPNKGRNSEKIYNNSQSKPMTRIEEYRFNAALRILTLAIQLLWKGRNVLDSEFNAAFLYIRENYLNHPNIKELAKFEKRAIQRLELAENYCTKHNYELAVFPRKYFDKTYEKGFAATQQWLVNAQKQKVKKQINEQEFKDRQMLIKLYSKFKNHNNTAAFKSSTDYIKSLIPNQLDNFMLLTQSNPKQPIINKFLTSGKL